jgi:hypothetical protein
VTFNVTDSDGDTSSSKTLSVQVPATLGLGACVIDVPNLPFGVAGSAQAVNLLAQGCVTGVPPGTTVSFVAGTVSGGGSLVSSPSSGAWTYIPPAGKMTRYKRSGSAAVTISNDVASLGFSAFLVENPDVQVTGGAATIRFEGTEDTNPLNAAAMGDAISFSTMQRSLKTECGQCHASPDPPTNTNTSYPTDASMHWAGIVDGTNAQRIDAYKRLRCWADVTQLSIFSGYVESGTSYFNAASPLSSALVDKPRGNLNHGGGDRGIADTEPDLLVQQWMRQGGYLTEGAAADQGCASGVPTHTPQ